MGGPPQSSKGKTMFYLSWLGIIALSATFTCGITATLFPARFANTARFWSQWIETRPMVPFADHRVDIDEFVLRHTRVFGVAILSAASFWTALLVIAF